MDNKKSTIGGQAFHVGILMRGRKNAAAFTKADGEIYVKTWEVKKTGKLPKVPVVRGLVAIGKAVMDGAVTTAELVRSSKSADKTGPHITKLRKYHGAEHKTIACYEKGIELTVENVQQQSRIHPRCGTSVAVTALLAQTLITVALPRSIAPQKRENIELAAMVLSMGLSYELNRKAWRGESKLAEKLTAPGRWAQKLTTAEPDDEMINCAIAALEAAK